MWRNIDTAVFFRTGKTKHMVILVDGAAYGTQGVMTVGQYIRYRKRSSPEARAVWIIPTKSDIMRSQFIKFNLKLVHIAGGIMGF